MDEMAIAIGEKIRLDTQGRLSRFADTFYLRKETWSFAFPTPCKQCRSAVQTKTTQP